jgi:hypothetical protein
MRRTTRERAAEAYGVATVAIKDFWGVGHNRPDAFSALERVLTSHGLNSSQLDRLRMELPPITPGTTGAKVRQVDSLLQRLTTAAGGG